MHWDPRRVSDFSAPVANRPETPAPVRAATPGRGVSALTALTLLLLVVIVLCGIAGAALLLAVLRGR